MTRHHCTSCGRAHELTAHHDPAAMDREAAIATEQRDRLHAAIWRARAAATRAGHVHRDVKPETQPRLPEVA